MPDFLYQQYCHVFKLSVVDIPSTFLLSCSSEDTKDHNLELKRLIDKRKALNDNVDPKGNTNLAHARYVQLLSLTMTNADHWLSSIERDKSKSS